MAFSQTYPVQTFVQVSPPHTSYLPDYSDPFSNQMKIFLTLTDFTVPSYQVKLRFTFTGNGYSITTSSLLNLPTTTLSPGTPVEISGNDLAPYLSSQNLIFSGIDVADYELRKILPEGPCQICVEVVDFSNPNQTVLSNPACTQVWFSLNDPPLLNTPFCGNQIIPTDPQQVIFSWTPLHMNSLHSAGTQYIFELFEIRPEGADPNQVVNSTLPIFMQVTDQTYINYGITEPQLQVGMSYAWRVRAQDIQGRDFFRNNGYSAVCTFTYGNIASSLADGITLELNSNGTGTRMGLAWWNVSSTFTHYKLEVRKTGNSNYEWFPYESTTGELKVYQLEPSTQYECKVKGLIGTEYESEWSNISVFTTQPAPDYACGSTTLPPGEINFTPLTNAIAGLTFTVGQFEMLVTDIEPVNPITQPGHYRGTGKIAVGFAIVNLRVSFEDILVDDNLLVRSGKVEAITEGIDAWLNNHNTPEPDYYVDGVITDFAWNDSTSLTVWVDGQPQNFSFADHDPIIIQDEEGMIYTFNSDGTYTVISILIYSQDVLAGNSNYRIDFSKDPGQVYGFDKKEYSAWIHDYEVIKLTDSSNYFVSYKSLAPSETDYVIANIKSAQPLTGVSFIAVNSGVTTNLTAQNINDSTYRVTLSDLSESCFVYAVHEGNRIGKLWVKVLPQIQKEIVLVPVNGATLSQISEAQTQLNAIYKQANVTFTVTTKSNFQSTSWDLNGDGKLQTGDVDLMSHYSEEMRLLRDEYFASDTAYNKNAYHIFIIPQFLETDLAGYMVRGKGVGFLKNGETSRTAAHELAHGIFALEHTFPDIEEGTTENLLDYSATGTHLAQKQWYWIHEPLPAFSMFDEEEEGESTKLELLSYIKNHKGESKVALNYMSFIDEWSNQHVDQMWKEINGEIVHLRRHFVSTNSFIDLSITNGSYNSVDLSFEITDQFPYTTYSIKFFYLDILKLEIFTDRHDNFQQACSYLGMTPLSTFVAGIIDEYQDFFSTNTSCSKTTEVIASLQEEIFNQLSGIDWLAFIPVIYSCSHTSATRHRAIANLIGLADGSEVIAMIDANKLYARQILRDAPTGVLLEYVYAFSKTGESVWSDTDIEAAAFAFAYPFSKDEYNDYGMPETRYYCSLFNEDDIDDLAKTTFEIGGGYSAATSDNTTILLSDKQIMAYNAFNFFDPVKLVFGDGEIISYTPAFVAHEVIRRYRNSSTIQQVIQFFGDFLLPELTLAKMARFPKLFKFKSAFVGGVERFIAKTAVELQNHLSTLVNRPIGKPYNGQFYKSINLDFHPIPNPQLIDDYATLKLDHRYSKVGESGYYVSATDAGNLTEMKFLNGVPSNYARFRYDNVTIDNMLYLTDDFNRQRLGVTEDMIKMVNEDKYKFTHVIEEWARNHYKGIVYPGAQGGDYTNIIIFKQSDVDAALNGLKAVRL